MADFSYDLPLARIASRPLASRDEAKLLHFGGDPVGISHRQFSELPRLLPEDSLLIANKSKVVAARILCEKETGGKVEVLLTEPVSPSNDPAVVLQSSGVSQWNCLIGGRNVHSGMVLTEPLSQLSITVISRVYGEGVVEIDVQGAESLAELLDRVGHIPLPPYIKRDDDTADRDQYQTIFAKEEGSVAAPTAGLHFTEDVLTALESRGVKQAEVTLHVGLGTFQPVDVDDLRDHTMHRERIEIGRECLDALLNEASQPGGSITAVGTTSMRTLESFYWYGVKLINSEPTDGDILCDQWDAFQDGPHPARHEAFTAVRSTMKEQGVDRIVGYTQLCLAPGAHIAVVDQLVTNFHQSGNTLIMLVAAFVGDAWREIYESALANGYRFLSYGDSSLLVRQ